MTELVHPPLLRYDSNSQVCYYHLSNDKHFTRFNAMANCQYVSPIQFSVSVQLKPSFPQIHPQNLTMVDVNSL